MKRLLSFLMSCALIAIVYLTALLVSAGFVGLERLSAAIHDSDFFAVIPERVVIEGARRLDRSEMLLLAGLDRRVSWFDIDEHRIELFIRANGWTKRCAVNTVFPNGVRIFVEEYEPAVVVYRRETTGEGGEALYGMWFADRDGTVFKKMFPGEHRSDLPLFFVESDVSTNRQRELIRRAVAIADEWNKHRGICLARGISYGTVEGFSLECEFPDRRRSTIVLGDVADDEVVSRCGELFRRTAASLRAKRLFAGEYLFETHGGETKLVAGRLVQHKE